MEATPLSGRCRAEAVSSPLHVLTDRNSMYLRYLPDTASGLSQHIETKTP